MSGKIGSGKKITISKGRESVVGILDEEVSFTAQSSYVDLLDNLGAGKLIEGAKQVGTLVSSFSDFLGLGITKDASFVFKEASIPRWAGTEPLQMSLNISFYQDQTDASGQSIYVATQKLISWSLPTDEGGEGGNAAWKGLKPPIPSDATVLIREASDYRNKSNNFINLKIGNILKLNKVIITQVDATYSTNSNQASYPVSIKLLLQIRTLSASTVGLLTHGMKK